MSRVWRSSVCRCNTTNAQSRRRQPRWPGRWKRNGNCKRPGEQGSDCRGGFFCGVAYVRPQPLCFVRSSGQMIPTNQQRHHAVLHLQVSSRVSSLSIFHPSSSRTNGDGNDAMYCPFLRSRTLETFLLVLKGAGIDPDALLPNKVFLQPLVTEG